MEEEASLVLLQIRYSIDLQPDMEEEASLVR
jgi:hypothetical protein